MCAVKNITLIILCNLCVYLFMSCGSSGGAKVKTTAVIAPIEMVSLSSGWDISKKPVHDVVTGVASDPCVIKKEGTYWMYFTKLNTSTNHTYIACAKSQDGFAWTDIDSGSMPSATVVSGRDALWDQACESPYAVEHAGLTYLYYSGYRSPGDPMTGFPASLGLASSNDGIVFSRIENDPILSPAPGGLYTHAIYSPVVIIDGTDWKMIFCAHAYAGPAPGIRILGAKSSDGKSWEIIDDPVLEAKASYSWMSGGAAEPALIESNGKWWLFFTGMEGENRVIGLAEGSSPFGPWTIHPDPIVTPDSESFANDKVLAPHVIIEGNRARMWLLGTNSGSERITIGYAESAWPPIPTASPAGITKK